MRRRQVPAIRACQASRQKGRYHYKGWLPRWAGCSADPYRTATRAVELRDVQVGCAPVGREADGRGPVPLVMPAAARHRSEPPPLAAKGFWRGATGILGSFILLLTCACARIPLLAR